MIIGRCLAVILILFALMEMSAKAGTLSPTIPMGQLTGGGNVTSPEESGAALAPMSDGEKQGFGCLISGSLSLGATLLANPNEMIMVIAGGTLAPTTTIGVGVAILGTVFASICAVGAIATPAIRGGRRSGAAALNRAARPNPGPVTPDEALSYWQWCGRWRPLW
jgi:hypothetical protein